MPTKYNSWYTSSYDTILTMAAWETLDSDIKQKITLIFSWMPMTIMNISHAGKTRKHDRYDPAAIQTALAPSRSWFSGIRAESLLEFDIKTHQRKLESLCDALFPCLGPVAASKYLHFSAHTLLPMWDRALLTEEKLPCTGAGYVNYVQRFQDDIRNPANQKIADSEYPGNLVRGWDIHLMKIKSA